MEEAHGGRGLPAGPKDSRLTVLTIKDEAVILAFQRQQHVVPERHNHRFLFRYQHSGMNSLRPHWGIADARLLTPLLDGGWIGSMLSSQRPQALLIMLYRSTERLCRAGRSHVEPCPMASPAMCDGHHTVGSNTQPKTWPRVLDRWHCRRRCCHRPAR